eukprot:1962533-Prymnesium_polylepis.1
MIRYMFIIPPACTNWRDRRHQRRGEINTLPTSKVQGLGSRRPVAPETYGRRYSGAEPPPASVVSSRPPAQGQQAADRRHPSGSPRGAAPLS